MISNNMLEHIRKSIEDGELFAPHVPVVKQLLESFDEQASEIARLRASRLAIVESLDLAMRERDLLKAQLAATWQPVAKDTKINDLSIEDGGSYIRMDNDGDFIHQWLPDNLRVCERVQP